MKGSVVGGNPPLTAQQRGRVIGQRLGGPLWILTIVFATAKVFGFSTMSWLWVFAPVWIVLGGTLAFFLLCALVLGIVAAFVK